MTKEIEVNKVIFMYSDRSETSRMLADEFVGIAEQLKRQRCYFAKINLDRNEIPDLQDVEVPALIILKGFGDLNGVNYEGSWTREDMKTFIYNRVYQERLTIGNRLSKKFHSCSVKRN
jgi:hypothetical protein